MPCQKLAFEQLLEPNQHKNLKLRAEPITKAQGVVFVCKGIGVASARASHANGVGLLDPLGERKRPTVFQDAIFNGLRTIVIEIGIFGAFPDHQEQEGAVVLQPMVDQVGRALVELTQGVG